MYEFPCHLMYFFIFNLQVWDDIPEEAKNFVDVCLDKNQDSRPTSSDLLHHAWLGKHTTMNSIKANLEKMNNLSRRTSHVSSSHPRSIAVHNLLERIAISTITTS